MASATANQLTDDSCCAYCLQRLPYMVDPRQLPCSHVFCLSCLKADSAEISATRCRICGKSHEIEDLDTLAVADDTTTGKDRSTKLLTKVLCDVCTGHRSISITYCCDCKKHYCEEHKKPHDLILGATHTMITDIPRDSSVRACHEHAEENLSLACSVCHKAFCTSCDTESGCESSLGGDGEHTIVQLDELSKQLSEEMYAELKKFSGDITEACKAEKAVWSDMDDVEVKVEKMRREVDRVAKQKTWAIQRRTKEVQDDLKKYFDEVSMETEERSSHLMSNIEHCQNLWRSMNQMRQPSDLDVIQQHNMWMGMLRKNPITNPVQRKRKHPKRTLVTVGELSKMRSPIVDHSVCPTSAEFINMCKGTFNCVSWNDDGNLVAGGTTLTLFSQSLVELKVCSVTDGFITAVDQGLLEQQVSTCSGVANYLVFEGNSVNRNEYNACIYSPALVKEKTIFKHEVRGTSYPLLATHHQSSCIIATVPSTLYQPVKSLPVFSAEGEKKFEINSINIKSQGIHCLPDGTILITYPNDGLVGKYFLDIAAQTSTNIWECSVQQYPTAISSDSGQYIYIGSDSSSDIYILSPSGSYLKSISLGGRGLSNIRDIAISGTKMAVACGDNGLFLFDLYREQPTKFDLDQYITENKL